MPERLPEPGVPDPRDQTLIEKRLAHETGLIRAAKNEDELLDVSVVGEEVLSQGPDGPRVERQDRTVPLRRHPLSSGEHQPGATTARQVVPARLDSPAAAHAEVAPDDDASLEAQQEVLAYGLDPFEGPTVDCAGHSRREPTRVRALRLEPLTDEHL